MTNQEIYEKVGDIGVLTTTYICMGKADGDFTEDEFLNVYRMVSVLSENPKSAIEDTLDVINELSFQEKIDFAGAGLRMLSDKLDSKTKEIIMASLAKIAESDGVISDEEQDFFADVKKILKA
jgi:uncharacterized tellurite resistance protein B-like protein